MLYRRQGLAILLSVILILLAGCTDPAHMRVTIPSSQTEDTQAEVLSSEPSASVFLTIPEIPLQNSIQPGSPQKLSDWFFTNYQESFSWTDRLGNLCFASITLPALTPVDTFAVAFNEEIHTWGTYMLEDIRYASEAGYASLVLSVGYQCWLNDDILSILLTIHQSDGTVQYKVWNFDVEDRTPLSPADMADDVLGMDYPSFLIASGQIIQKNFEMQYLPILPDESSPFLTLDESAVLQKYGSILESIGHDTVEISARRLLQCENGQVLMVYSAPTLDGAAYYTAYCETIVPWESTGFIWENKPTEGQAYHALFYLTHQVDGAYADAYSRILQMAFLADPDDFAEYAFNETAATQESLQSLLTYGLDASSLQEMQLSCQEVLNDQESSISVIAFIQSLSAALSD